MMSQTTTNDTAVKPVSSGVAAEKLLAEIAANEDHRYFDILREQETGLCLCETKDHDITACKNKFTIDWLSWAAKIYRRSHSTNTITSYCKGVCAFREFLAQSHNKALCIVVNEIRANNALAYDLLDDFVTYCDAQRVFMPRTTINAFQAVIRLFAFLKIDLDDNKLDDISLPRPSALADEYPPNQFLRLVVNSAASKTIRGYIETIIDAGFEPVDAAQLKVSWFKFDESPVRITKDREKTGQRLEGFISDGTAETIKQIIRLENKQPGDYIFASNFTGYTVKNLRDSYNLAVARAGFGEVIKDTRNGSTRYRARIQKIEGHSFGKYHLKVLKKRWFTLAITAGVPEYVAQGMLGRKQYLDQYLRLPLEKKQEYAKKILKAVSIYSDKADKQEVIDQVAKSLGIDASTLNENTLRGLGKLLQNYHALPDPDKKKLLGER